jgi:hypothetical protein
MGSVSNCHEPENICTHQENCSAIKMTKVMYQFIEPHRDEVCSINPLTTTALTDQISCSIIRPNNPVPFYHSRSGAQPAVRPERGSNTNLSFEPREKNAWVTLAAEMETETGEGSFSWAV